jgi:hypothetical protein
VERELMTIKRYGVLDADGVKINTITADDAQINTDWYPGYGAALVDEGDIEPDPPKPEPVKRPDTWGVLELRLAEPLLVGDRVDLKTLEVTRREDLIEVAVDIEPQPMPVTIGPVKI